MRLENIARLVPRLRAGSPAFDARSEEQLREHYLIERELADRLRDVAYSNQLMEHLHPEDASEQLREIHRSLVPGGIYLCITPNRLHGPRDISAHFDEAARGLHLREYAAHELRRLLLEAGFSEVRFYAGGGGRATSGCRNSRVALRGAQAPRRVRRPLAEARAAAATRHLTQRGCRK